MGVAVKESQYTKILRKLQTEGKVSNFELFKLTPRYSARIHELRNDGYDIVRSRDVGNIWVKPQNNKFWYTLNGRFEINEYADID